jgi:two-component system, sensor histidine kinase RegB
MSDSSFNVISKARRSNLVRLRTLIMLRWIAILGQITAISAAQFLFDLQIKSGAGVMVVGAAVIANLLAIFIYPESKRLRENEVTAMLLFDIAQLSLLLFLTGGLHNPFALLILAPVTIAATVLRLKSTVLIGLAAIIFVSLLALFHFPITNATGLVLEVPLIFLFGSWLAMVVGVVFLGIYSWRVTSEIHSMSEAFLATQMALAREQKLTDLGGVVAAAAHELGTPLATIKLVSSELMEDLHDRPELLADAQLIHQQSDRCRDILRSMGRAGKDDLHLRVAPLETVIREAAEPHMERGKDVLIDVFSEDDASAGQMLLPRRPEIIHGLRNLIQNAVDFAASTVWIDAIWSADKIELRIIDDGPGYPVTLIGRIGEPFMRQRKTRDAQNARPQYEGMGLGLFIAKTLLERSGAELTFANASDARDLTPRIGRRSGALIEIRWSQSQFSKELTDSSTGLGENRPIKA